MRRATAFCTVLDAAIFVSLRCLIERGSCPGPDNRAETNRSLDMPEPSAREMACCGLAVWASCEAVRQHTVRVPHRANDPPSNTSDDDGPIEGPIPHRIEQERPIVTHLRMLESVP